MVLNNIEAFDPERISKKFHNCSPLTGLAICGVAICSVRSNGGLVNYAWITSGGLKNIVN